MRAVHFGAGAIGRGFIAALLHEGGYDVCFVDVRKDIVDALNRDGDYRLHWIDANRADQRITGVSALSPVTSAEAVIDAIGLADIVTTSVWAENLKHIAPLLARGLLVRSAQQAPRLSVIACENSPASAELLRTALLAQPGMDERTLVSSCHLPNTVVDRMVFESGRSGDTTVEVGAEFELVIEGRGDETAARIGGAIYSENLQRYLDRKLYLANCAHAWASYVGQCHGYTLVQDVFADDELREGVRATMNESARSLVVRHGFEQANLDRYIEFIINRFRTPGLADLISRVGRSPVRKLAARDRLTGPCTDCEALGLPNDNLALGIAAALQYVDDHDPQSVMIRAYVANHDLPSAIERFTGIDPESLLATRIAGHYRDLAAITLKRSNA